MKKNLYPNTKEDTNKVQSEFFKTSKIKNDILKKDSKAIFDKEELQSLQKSIVKNSDDKIQYFIPSPDSKITKKYLTKKMVSCLIFVYRHYKYSGCDIRDYFSKKDLLKDIRHDKNLISDFRHLKYWDLICQMPTSPNEIIYKKGWYGITNTAIRFIQAEIGLPKISYIAEKRVFKHQTIPYVMISDYFTEKQLELLLKVDIYK